MEPERWNNTLLKCGLILAAVSLAQYSYSIGNDLVMDSVYAFARDHAIRSISNIPSFFTGGYIEGADADIRENLRYYRPLLKALHSIEYQLFGTSPVWYNLVNIVLNAFVVLLAFSVVREFSGSADIALWSSLLYAVNPTRVEAVSWAYSDAYIIAAMLTLLCLLMFHRRRYVMSMLCFSLSVMVFEGALLLAAILPAYLLLIRNKRGRRDYIWAAAFISISFFYMLIRSSVVGPAPLTDIGILPWLNGASVVISTVMRIFLLPDGPVALYIYRPGMFSAFSAPVLLSYLAVACAILMGAFIFRRSRQLFFWFLWFFAWPAVFLNIGKFGEFYLNEKVLYLASLGPCVIIVSAGASLLKDRQLIFRVALIALVMVHFAITYSRTLYWRDNSTYMAEARRAAPDSVFVHNWFARGYARKQRYDEARGEYEASLRLYWPQPLAHLNLGNIYYMQGDTGRAVASWKESARYGPSSPEPYNNLCLVLMDRGETEAARGYCDTYERLKAEGRLSPPADPY